MTSTSRRTIEKELKEAEREVKERATPIKKRKRRIDQTKSTTTTTAKKKKSSTARKKTTTSTRKRTKGSKPDNIVETIFSSDGLPRILRLILGFLILGFILYGYWKYSAGEKNGFFVGNTMFDLEVMSKIFWGAGYTGVVFFFGYKFAENRRKK